MAKKRKQKKSRPQNRKNHRQAFSGDNRNRHFRSGIISFLYRTNGAVSLDEITKEFSRTKSDRKDITNDLYELVDRGLVIKKGKKHFSLLTHNKLFEGKLESNAKGFGFVTGLSSEHGEPPQKDVFVSKYNLTGATHGDRVLVLISKQKKDKRLEGKILTILKKAPNTIAGFFSENSHNNLVIPEDHRYPFQIQLTGTLPEELNDGDAVLVQIERPKEKSKFVPGKIVRILGSPENVDVQMQLVIEKYSLPHAFSEEALKEAKAHRDIISDKEREDLREIPHVTIDGETAKDFDDAIAVIKSRKGFRLYVSIADVSHFVTPGSALDKDAYERGTSIYFPGRVIPMLPENLSNNLCSLIPDQDRLAFTAILDFDRQGKLQKKDFCKSIIRSHKRFTYNIVQEIIIEKNPAVRRQHKPFLTPLKWAMELAEQLQQRRIDRGSIGFNIPEPDIRLDENGNIISMERTCRLFSHQLIEEFMLAANEAVAATFTENNIPVLYRIHEQPAPEKVDEFIAFAKTLDLKLPEAEVSPAWFAEILTTITGSPKEYIFNNLLLRTMQQARYSPGNQGHFGLAATDYTHFTSPIRRYPDLHVHRTLMKLLQSKKKGIKHKEPAQEQLNKSGTYLSSRERTAIDAERDIHDRLKIFFMEKFIGDNFKAIISGVTGSALFVEVLSPFVSGSIGLEELKDDFYIYDHKHHRLIGDVGLKIYQLGDLVTVKLLGVDKQKHRLNFTIVEKVT